ncbi:hypothetical protein OG481_09615 [Streptomyces longwoodensis]|uniref:hypothetical protein n=1 Tax=Streptomyces longwoodensis TaxID=68231 RepID=UPI002DD90D7A|nr:hypothetical protein [Streptomyces longwoodensis]WRY88773.1 hypothetical protein OG481_09615 [Streptomyces longwoodensis]
MADEDTPREAGTQDGIPPLEVDMEFVDSIPGERVVMPLERRGKWVWLVEKGHVSPEAMQQMVQDLNHVVRSGLWRQNWQPPQADS